MPEDTFVGCKAEENFIRKLRGYMADDLETKGVQKSQGQEHNIGLQVGKRWTWKTPKFKNVCSPHVDTSGRDDLF